MDYNPSEANSSSAGQATPAFCRTPRFRTMCKKSPPLVPIRSQINPFYSPSYFLKIHFNIILPITPCYSKWSSPNSSMPHPSHSPSSDRHNTMRCSVQIMLQILTRSPLFPCTLRPLSPSILLSNALSPSPYPNVTDTVVLYVRLYRQKDSTVVGIC